MLVILLFNTMGTPTYCTSFCLIFPEVFNIKNWYMRCHCRVHVVVVVVLLFSLITLTPIDAYGQWLWIHCAGSVIFVYIRFLNVRFLYVPFYNLIFYMFLFLPYFFTLFYTFIFYMVIFLYSSYFILQNLLLQHSILKIIFIYKIWPII